MEDVTASGNSLFTGWLAYRPFRIRIIVNLFLMIPDMMSQSELLQWFVRRDGGFSCVYDRRATVLQTACVY